MESSRIVFPTHGVARMLERGVTKGEVEAAIAGGERLPARKGRTAYRKNFPFEARWKNRYYETKQVTAIVMEEDDKLVLVTVFAFYFGGPR